MKIPNTSMVAPADAVSLARIVSEDSQLFNDDPAAHIKSSKDS